MNHFKTFPQHHTVMSTVYRTFTCSLLLVLLSALPGWATTYYVKNGGNDSYVRSGVEVIGWRDLPQALRGVYAY